MQDRGLQRLEGGEETRQFGAHPVRVSGAGDPGNAKGFLVRQPGQKGRGRHIKKHDSGHTGKGEHLHHGRRAGEVIAIEGEQRDQGFHPP